MFHLLAVCIGFGLYFLPALVAHKRAHPSTGAIFLVNFFLGWTGIGWAVCLVWALSGESRVVLLQPAGVPHALYCTRCGARTAENVCATCGARM